MNLSMRAGLLALLVTGCCMLSFAEDAAVPKGYRGVAVPVSGWLAEALKAGDRVDVVVAYNRPVPPMDAHEGIVPSTATVPVVATFLQNIKVGRVLAADHSTGQGAVLLVVNPVEAQYLAWALAFGKGIVLSIRGVGDTETHPMEEAGVNRFSR